MLSQAPSRGSALRRKNHHLITATKSARFVDIPTYLQTLWQHRRLIWTWALREIKVRYRQTVLGGLWAILQPLSLTIVFTLIFAKVLKVPTGDVPYPVFAYAAMLPWSFFANSLNFASNSLVSNMSLVQKVYFPREVLPLASLLAGLIDLGFASLVYLGLLILYRWPLTIAVMWIPLLLAIQLLLMIGVSLFLAAIMVFYRDVRFVLPLLLQIWFYATPIVYPIALIPERFLPIYSLNPMAALINSYRQVLVHGQAPDFTLNSLGLLVAIAIFFLGYRFFKAKEREFADVV